MGKKLTTPELQVKLPMFVSKLVSMGINADYPIPDDSSFTEVDKKMVTFGLEVIKECSPAGKFQKDLLAKYFNHPERSIAVDRSDKFKKDIFGASPTVEIDVEGLGKKIKELIEKPKKAAADAAALNPPAPTVIIPPSQPTATQRTAPAVVNPPPQPAATQRTAPAAVNPPPQPAAPRSVTTDPQSEDEDKQLLQKWIDRLSAKKKMTKKDKIDLLAAKAKLTKIQKQEFKEQLDELREQAPKNRKKIKAMEQELSFLQAKHLAAKGLFALLTDNPLVMRDQINPGKGLLFNHITNSNNPEKIIEAVTAALDYCESFQGQFKTYSPGGVYQPEEDSKKQDEIDEVIADLQHLLVGLEKKHGEQLRDPRRRTSDGGKRKVGFTDDPNYKQRGRKSTPDDDEETGSGNDITLAVSASGGASAKMRRRPAATGHDYEEEADDDNEDAASIRGNEENFSSGAESDNKYDLYIKESSDKGAKLKEKGIEGSGIAPFGGLERRVIEEKHEQRKQEIQKLTYSLKKRQERTKEIKTRLSSKLGQALEAGQEIEKQQLQKELAELEKLDKKIEYKKTKANIYDKTTVTKAGSKLAVTIENEEGKPTFNYDVVSKTDGSLVMTTNNELSAINEDHKMIVQFIDNAIKAGKSTITVTDLYKPGMDPTQQGEADKIAHAFKKYCRLAGIKCDIDSQNRLNYGSNERRTPSPRGGH